LWHCAVEKNLHSTASWYRVVRRFHYLIRLLQDEEDALDLANETLPEWSQIRCNGFLIHSFALADEDAHYSKSERENDGAGSYLRHGG
jgi:hypothetical protein